MWPFKKKKIPVLIDIIGGTYYKPGLRQYTVGCLVCGVRWQKSDMWDPTGTLRVTAFRCARCGAYNTLDTIQRGMRQRLINQRTVQCKYCHLPPAQHADDKKCLFHETSYTPIGDDGLVIEEV